MDEVQGEYIDDSLCVCIDHDHDLDHESKPWYQQPDEPTEWYERFAYHYLPMPTPRSILGAYKSYLIEQGRIEPVETSRITNVPPLWYDVARQWQWEQRAQAQDKSLLDQWMTELEHTRDVAKRLRVNSSLRILSKVDAAVDMKTIDELSQETLASLSLAHKNAVRESRIELEDQPQQHNQLTIIINQLPPDVQKAIAKLLPSLSST